MRIAVTGGAGKVGGAVVHELRKAGHRVTALDIAGPRQDGLALHVDFADYGQTVDALFGASELVGTRTPISSSVYDGVVHFAAIPAPALRPDVTTFLNNITSTFNVIFGAMRAGIKNVVIASSETVLGLPFITPPDYVPLDENSPSRPESIYGLVKHLEEELAEQLVRWYPEVRITALRLSNVIVDPEEYRAFPAFETDPTRRRWNLWSYIDVRDAAQAALQSLLSERSGLHRYNIAASDTVMQRTTRDLLAEFFPDVPVRGEIGAHGSLQSTVRAREELGFEPLHSWRDTVSV